MSRQYPGDFVYFGPKANCTLELCDVGTSVYGYRPHLAANITFIALYAVAIAVHVLLGFRWKAWWFVGCIVASCIDEIVGYVGRIMLYYNPWSFAAFMIQIICITIGPVFYCAAIYGTLARVINHFAPSLSRFPTRLFYWVFIPCDIVSLVLQGAGGALSTNSEGSNSTGVNITLAGLAFQVVTLVAFSAFFIDFLVRLYRLHHKGGSNGVGEGPAVNTPRVRLFFGFLSAAVLLTLGRCIYRVDELSEGYDGPLIANEGLFIGLEGVLVILSIFALCIGHPGMLLNKDPQSRRSSKGVITEANIESGPLIGQEK